MLFTLGIRTYLKRSVKMSWEFYFDYKNKNNDSSKHLKIKNISICQISFFSFKEHLWSCFIMDIYSWKIISQKWGYITIIYIGILHILKLVHFHFQLRIHLITQISKKLSRFSSSTRDEKLTVISITIASLFSEYYAKKRITIF